MEVMCKRLLLVLLVGSGLCLISGCGGAGQDGNKIENVNGFFCPQCESRYYTAGDELLERCGQCGAPVQPVGAYNCPGCGTVTLDGSGRGAVPCPQCKTMMTTPRYPTEEELKEWGAERVKGGA